MATKQKTPVKKRANNAAAKKPAKALAVINGNSPVLSGLHLQIGDKGEHFEVIPAGIAFKRGIDREEWLGLTEKAIGDYESTRDSHLLTLLRVGDALAHGKLEFPEEYGQAIDATSKAIRLSTKTLQNAQWICGSVAAERRQLMLTLAHHEAVAKLTPKEQTKFLKDALEEEWSVADLKAAIKKAHPNPKRKPPGGSKKVTLDLDTEDGCLTALERIVTFAEDATTPGEVKEGETKINTHPEDWSKERKGKWFPHICALIRIFSPAEAIALSAANRAAEYLGHPDNAPLDKFTAKRQAQWHKPLGAFMLAAADFGLETPKKPKGKGGKGKETPAEPAPEASPEPPADGSEGNENPPPEETPAD